MNCSAMLHTWNRYFPYVYKYILFCCIYTNCDILQSIESMTYKCVNSLIAESYKEWLKTKQINLKSSQLIKMAQ
jgi:hypothetical protein